VLWPVSLVFGAVTALRRALFRSGVFGSTRLPLPVIVIGNINVGGTGKTPLVIWLARWLREQGRQPGIVSRGYRKNAGGAASSPQMVRPDSDPQVVGDEAVLLARRSDSPVWVGADRVAVAQALLAAHPECNVILSDDGLQHYALARDIEIAVVDGARGFGNGMLLPAGPLREAPQRLDGIDAIVINGAAVFSHDTLPHSTPIFDMQLVGNVFYNLLNPEKQVGPEHFLPPQTATVDAVAAIGNPKRFFDTLRELGISFTAHPFPDHHPFSAEDFSAFATGNGDNAVIVTEKDAVKCERFCNEQVWALQVDADVDAAFGDLMLNALDKRH
jgi:tetraacyldisaccharide 4'-kinase